MTVIVLANFLAVLQLLPGEHTGLDEVNMGTRKCLFFSPSLHEQEEDRHGMATEHSVTVIAVGI